MPRLLLKKDSFYNNPENKKGQKETGNKNYEDQDQRQVTDRGQRLPGSRQKP